MATTALAQPVTRPRWPSIRPLLASVLAFGALFGLIGAVIGVPIAAAIQIVIEELTAARRARIAAADAAPVEPRPMPDATRPDRHDHREGVGGYLHPTLSRACARARVRHT